MAKILVFHFTEQGRAGKMTRNEQIEVRNKFLEVLKDYPDVRFNGTFVDENGMGICDWDAPSPEVVKEIIWKAVGSLPVDPVVAVRQILL